MNFWEGKKVFIAGGAGLIGQALIRALVPLGAKITATEFLARRIDKDWRDKILVLSGFDLRYPKSSLYDGFDVVFWAAAKVGGAKSIREHPMELVHYNLDLATRNIYAAVKAGVGRFCYVSSSYVYGEPGFRTPCIETETEAFDVPRQHYGLGWIKRFIEKLCQAHQLTSETRFALVRPAAIYGPYDNFDLETCHVVPALIRKVAERQNPLEVWGDGSEQRQFTFADDLAQGLLLATEHYAIADPINIATSQVSSVNDVWQTLFKIEQTIKTPTIDTFDFRPWNIKSGGDSYCRDVKYLGDKPNVISRRVISSELCALRLGYECKTTLEDGLRKTLQWYRANHL